MKKWNKNEIGELKLYYKQFNVPSDQIVKDKDTLENFTKGFNAKLDDNERFSSEEIADQLFKLRKGGKLPRVRK
jgi:5'-deoxynucleotidase YfbR-like HD superfamily hydrolase